MNRRIFLQIAGLSAVGAAVPREIFPDSGVIEIELLRIQNVDRQYYFVPAVAVPKGLSDVLAQHIQEIKDLGYAYELSEDDFFHGHFLFDRNDGFQDKEELRLEDYFSHVRGAIYHTREFLFDWVSGSDQNLPRSVVGLRDGTLTIPESDTEWYRDYGTVTGYDLQDLTQKVPKLIVNKNLFFADSQFRILLDKNGRFSLEDGQKYELYLILYRKEEY